MRVKNWIWVNTVLIWLGTSMGSAWAQQDMKIERTWPPISCSLDMERGVRLSASPKMEKKRLTGVTLALTHDPNMELRLVPTRIAFYSLPDGRPIQPTSHVKQRPKVESSGRVSDAIEFTFSSAELHQNVAFAFGESAIVQIAEGRRIVVNSGLGSRRLMDLARENKADATVGPACPLGLPGWKPKELIERRLVSQDLQIGLEAATEVLGEADIAPPENLILAALNLWRSGRREEAAFWLAAGIYRASYSGKTGLGYGYYIAMTNPILEHARSVPNLWANSLQKAVQWDDKTYAHWEEEQERSDENSANWRKKRTYQREDTLAYAKLLLADPNAPALNAIFPISGADPLRQALEEKNSPAALKIITSKSSDLNRQYPHDSSNLHLAASQGNLELIATLIDHGAKTEATDYLGNTPLGWARDTATIQALLDKGANVNALQGLDRQTLVLRLISSGTQQGLMENEKEAVGARIAVLLNHGADVNIGDAYGLTPLHVAASRGDIAMMSLLVGHGANVNAVTNTGKDRELENTPLAMAKNVETATFLMNKGASLQPPTGDTPLLNAVKNGNVDLVKLLLARGSDPNVPGRHLKFSALYYAIASKRLEHVTIAELLIKNGANVNAVVRNESMLQWAKNYRNTPLEKLLREAGAFEVQTSTINCLKRPCIPFPAQGAPIHVIYSPNGYVEPANQNNKDPEGEVHVRVSTPGAIVLLVSQSRILWKVEIDPNVDIRHIIALGLIEQKIQVEGGNRENISTLSFAELSSIAGTNIGPPNSYDLRNERIQFREISRLLTGEIPKTLQFAFTPDVRRIPLRSLTINSQTEIFSLPALVGPKTDGRPIILTSPYGENVKDYSLSRGVSGAYTDAYSDIAFSKGKIYVEGEMHVTGSKTANQHANFGVCRRLGSYISSYPTENVFVIRHDQVNQYKDGDVFGIAIDFDRGWVFRRLNGNWVDGEPDSEGGIPIVKEMEYRICAFASGTVSGEVKDGRPRSDTTWEINFGNKPFKNPVPSGFVAPL